MLWWFLFPLIPNFRKGGKLKIFVKIAHTCRLFAKKSRYAFGFGTSCFFLEVEILSFYFDLKGSLPVTIRMEFWLKPHYVYFSTWQKKLPRDTKDRRSRRGVRLRNNDSFTLSFCWCNTALCDTTTMEFSLYKKIRLPGV